MKVIAKIDLFFNRMEHALLVLLLSGMVLLAFAQVVLRNLFSTGFDWSEVLLRHLVLWLGFLGALLAASEERHIHIDALRHFIPDKLRKFGDVVTYLFAIIVCVLFSKAAYAFILSDVEAKHVIFGNVPSWVGQLIIPIGFGMLAFHFLIRLILKFDAETPQTPQVNPEEVVP